MIKITAKKHVTEIDILGQIGEDFFSEGNTLESVRAEIKDNDNPIIVNLASLGGSALEGLAIHDFLASFKQDVTVNIIGATASAAAVLSQAGDKVESSENSLFLVHKASGVAVGTADEMRKMAEEIETVNARMVAIFVKSTGKSEDEVTSLMDEDKFITAEEAKEFGFIDKVNPPSKIAASYGAKEIKASDFTDTQKEQLLNTTKMADKKTSVLATIKAEFAKIQKSLKADKVEVEILDLDETKAALTDIEARITEVETENTQLEEENDQLQAQIDKLTEAKEEADAGAEETEVEAKEDTEDPDNKKENPFDILAERLINNNKL